MPKTRKHGSSHSRSTRKHRGGAQILTQRSFDELIKNMLEVLTVVRLYHWKTHSYSTHVASGNLYDSLSGNIDKYAEAMIGKANGQYRIDMSNYKTLHVHGVDNNKVLATMIKKFINDVNKFHSKLHDYEYSEIKNIKDEIVGDLDKFLYLLTLA
jgi:hypothetical protein